MESSPGSGPSPAEAPEAGLPITVNMGRGERPVTSEAGEATPTPVAIDLSKIMLAGTGTEVEPVDKTVQPQVMTEAERAQNRLTKNGVYLPDGTVHPDVVAALVAEGHDADEVLRMSPTTLRYVMEQAVDENLATRTFSADGQIRT
jgi:hypothetical protein